MLIEEPPSNAGGVKLIVACALPAVATPIIGASGTVLGVTLTLADGALVPMALVAVTEHANVVPLISPVTISGEAAPVALKPPALHVAE